MIAPDASIGKCNDCRSTVSRDCDIVTRDPHELVNEIIILPNPVRHAPSRNAKQKIVALRPIFPLSPDLPPPSTSESKVDRPRSVSHAASGRFHGASRSCARGLSTCVHWIAASAAPRIAFGFSVVPLCTRTAASSMFAPLSVCTGMVHEWALPFQSPSFIQRRTTLW